MDNSQTFYKHIINIIYNRNIFIDVYNAHIIYISVWMSVSSSSLKVRTFPHNTCTSTMLSNNNFLNVYKFYKNNPDLNSYLNSLPINLNIITHDF